MRTQNLSRKPTNSSNDPLPPIDYHSPTGAPPEPPRHKPPREKTKRDRSVLALGVVCALLVVALAAQTAWIATREASTGERPIMATAQSGADDIDVAMAGDDAAPLAGLPAPAAPADDSATPGAAPQAVDPLTADPFATDPFSFDPFADDPFFALDPFASKVGNDAFERMMRMQRQMEQRMMRMMRDPFFGPTPGLRGGLLNDDGFFDDDPVIGARGGTFGMSVMPQVRTHAQEDRYEVRVRLPEGDENSVEYTVANGALTLSSSARTETEDRDENGEPLRSQRSVANWRQALPLPPGVDESAIESRTENGELIIVLPLTEDARQERRERLEQFQQERERVQRPTQNIRAQPDRQDAPPRRPVTREMLRKRSVT